MAPEWLQSWVPPQWLERYGRRIEEGLPPKGEAARQQYAEQVGADGVRLLARVQEADVPAVVREVATVKELGIVWQQQYEQQEGTVRLRNKDDLPPNAERHDFPYDPEVRYSTKRDLHWIGYKVHLTETCEDEQVHVLTHVETTYGRWPMSRCCPPSMKRSAPQAYRQLRTMWMQATWEVEVLLAEQQTKGIHLVGPVRPDPGWQAQQHTGYDTSQFVFDWQAKQATRPQGRTSVTWTERAEQRSGRPIVGVEFATATVAVPGACAVYACGADDSASGGASASRTRGLTAGTAVPADPGVSPGLCAPGWGRGHHLARCACLRAAAGTLSRLGKTHRGRTGYRDGAQPVALVSLASAHASG